MLRTSETAKHALTESDANDMIAFKHNLLNWHREAKKGDEVKKPVNIEPAQPSRVFLCVHKPCGIGVTDMRIKKMLWKIKI